MIDCTILQILKNEFLFADIELVKRCRGVPISFEWVVDSISRYEIKSAVEELYEIEVEEAKALGFPEEYLVESQSDPYGSDDEDE